MANIYGMPQSEKEILDRCPGYINNFEDIDKVFKESNTKLDAERKNFNDELPNRINEEKGKLENIKTEKARIIETSENKVKSIKNQLDKNKKEKKYFAVAADFAKILAQKYISKPIKVIKNQVEEKNQENVLFQWENNPEDFFNEQQAELLKKIATLKGIKTDSYYSGAYGEIVALKQLSKLSDNYHILCGVNIELKNWHSHHGSKIKTAQIDFLVISNKGIFIIEVKNWSDNYNGHHMSPHEQLERTNRVLYIFLKEELGDSVPIKGRLYNLLLPIKNNMRYDQDYKYIFVYSLDKINNFIDSKQSVLHDYEVEEIVDCLESHITAFNR